MLNARFNFGEFEEQSKNEANSLCVYSLTLFICASIYVYLSVCVHFKKRNNSLGVNQAWNGVPAYITQLLFASFQMQNCKLRDQYINNGCIDLSI